MAEEGAPRAIISNRNLIFMVGGAIVIAILFIFFSFAGCRMMGGAKDSGYQTIYSNLELKDTANVIARLKELKIPYEVKDKGTTIAVPKEKADDARLGLAEKSLPAGGMVGWEIFNETRMGATDFDRRIQLIRAISGELSRNIKRISGVEDARVQIVLPETKLFETTSAPVTAAVLLKIAPGRKLKVEQINGIVNLVASSVENLKPENVTVVDETGNILSLKGVERIPVRERITEVITTETKTALVEQQVIKKEERPVTPSPEAAAQVTPPPPPRPLTAEEKTMLRLRAREEFERQLNAKAQDILSQFYPLNSVIVRVNVEFGKPKVRSDTRLRIKTETSYFVEQIKKISAVILVDKRIVLTQQLKNNTYQTVALAINYNRKRGDRIVIKKVPFHQAVPITPPTQAAPVKKMLQLTVPGYLYWVIGGAVTLLLLFILFRIFRRKKAAEPIGVEEERGGGAPTETEAAATISELKNLAGKEPQKIASLIRKWLTEE